MFCFEQKLKWLPKKYSLESLHKGILRWPFMSFVGNILFATLSAGMNMYASSRVTGFSVLRGIN